MAPKRSFAHTMQLEQRAAMTTVVIMTVVNILGAQVFARTQTLIVYVVITILTIFAITTLINIDPLLLAFSGYPPFRDIICSAAPTLFAFLGFGIITSTAKGPSKTQHALPVPVPTWVPLRRPRFWIDSIDRTATGLTVAASCSRSRRGRALLDRGLIGS
jgi:hypothetical protein